MGREGIVEFSFQLALLQGLYYTAPELPEHGNLDDWNCYLDVLSAFLATLFIGEWVDEPHTPNL